MEQRIAALEAQVKQITDTFVKFMTVPYKQQKEMLERLAPLLALYENKQAPFEEKKKHTRRPLSKADWSRVQACLNDDEDSTSWSQVAKLTGIPQSTCRKYAKMTPEEVSALPEGINMDESEEGSEE